MFKIYLISSLVLISLIACDDSLDNVWREWMKINKKSYGRNELTARRAIWLRTHLKIQKHNSEADQGIHSYRMGHNEFSDLTFEEFSSKYLGSKAIDLKEYREKEPLIRPQSSKRSSIPVSVDYSTTGMVNPVQNQGSCGCCYAFAATGALEGQLYKSTGKSVVLSAQQLVECDNGANQFGCNGGMYDRSWTYIMKTGIARDSSYPYTLGSSTSPGTCKFDSSMAYVNVTSWSFTSPFGKWYNESALTEAIANVGPLAVSLYITSNFQSYSSGVFSDTTCNVNATQNGITFPDINHAVVAVGYDVDATSGKPYYLLKNQWGTSWGMNGYMKLERNANDMCHVASWAAYPSGVNEIIQVGQKSDANMTRFIMNNLLFSIILHFF